MKGIGGSRPRRRCQRPVRWAPFFTVSTAIGLGLSSAFAASVMAGPGGLPTANSTWDSLYARLVQQLSDPLDDTTSALELFGAGSKIARLHHLPPDFAAHRGLDQVSDPTDGGMEAARDRTRLRIRVMSSGASQIWRTTAVCHPGQLELLSDRASRTRRRRGERQPDAGG